MSCLGERWVQAATRPCSPALPFCQRAPAVLPTLQGEQEPQWELQILRLEQRDSPPDPPASSTSESAHFQQLNMIQLSWVTPGPPVPVPSTKGTASPEDPVPHGQENLQLSCW